MFRVAVVACLIALAVAMPIEFSAEEQFEAFMTRFGKSYASAEDKAHRFAVFQQTLARIEELNANEPFKPHGVNQFSDLTTEEFAAQYLMPKGAIKHIQAANSSLKKMNLEKFATAALPGTFDWRTNGSVLTPVKNQGQCGSCWAFSTTENVESVWALAGNTLTSLAPQQIVDCDKTDQGCNGGNPPTAYEYLIKAGGLEAETSYPYTAKDGSCKADTSKFVAKISSWEYITKNKNETEMQVATLNVSPLSICVDAITWQTYNSGIVTKNCGQSLDHCVQISGWGEQGSTTYWSIRNSWGVSWGESGYIRVEMGKNLCGLANEVTSAVAAN